MTEYYYFQPSNQVAPYFQPTLDGVTYTVYLKWNLFGQRFYAECHDSDDNLVFNTPIVETAPAITISILSMNANSLTATATTASPHGYPIGQVAVLTLTGAVPTDYIGTYQMLSTGLNTLTFPMSSIVGQATVPGEISQLIDIASGYFNSTLIFRNQQFEVNP